MVVQEQHLQFLAQAQLTLAAVVAHLLMAVLQVRAVLAVAVTPVIMQMVLLELPILEAGVVLVALRVCLLFLIVQAAQAALASSS